MATSLENGVANLGLANKDLPDAPISVSFPLPRAPQTNIYLQLHNNGPNILIFLTTSTLESTAAVSMGSLVYAMPNVRLYIAQSSASSLIYPYQVANPSDPLSTPLFTPPGSLDFTTRLAKLLARKLKKPVYVGNSMSFASAGMGGTVEEEMEGFKRVVEVVMGLIK